MMMKGEINQPRVHKNHLERRGWSQDWDGLCDWVQQKGREGVSHSGLALPMSLTPAL